MDKNGLITNFSHLVFLCRQIKKQDEHQNQKMGHNGGNEIMPKQALKHRKNHTNY